MLRSIFSKPDVIPTMKCISCGETLLWGRTECVYCGQVVDPNYALRSAMRSTYIAQACAWANSIRASSSVLMLVPLAIDIIGYLGGTRLYAVKGIIFSIFYASAVGYWCFKYGDVKIEDDELNEVRKEMKRNLHRWLGFITLQIFLLVILWSWFGTWIGEPLRNH